VPSARKLSIVIPAYNEERFIGTLLQRIIELDLSPLGVEKEIIVVNDCSRDRTAEIAAGFAGVKVSTLPRNSGTGEAVKTGITLATGDLLIIQDADLEYDPADYIPMLRVLLAGEADVVYGSRYTRHPERGRFYNLLTGKHDAQAWPSYLGGQSLSFVCLLFTGHYLADTVTALKLFKAETIKSLSLQTTGFELDHEITAKILASGCRILEVPIKYFPRTKAEGKKIGLKDWFIGTRTFFRYRKG
jgi:dolichol-phosphate mannosyltransferase